MDFENPTTENKEAPKPEEAKEKPAASPEAKKWTPAEEAEIQKIRAKKYGERMADRGLDKEIDAMILAEGLKPLTPEAEKFMNKKDWEYAEKEFEKRKEGGNLFSRILETFALMAGHENIAKAKEALVATVGVINEINSEEKITKDNMGSVMEKMLDRLPPDTIPWMKDFKEGEKGETLKDFIKDITSAVKIENEDERKKKLSETLDKFEIKGTIRSDIETLTNAANKFVKTAESGEGGEAEQKELEQTKGQAKGLMDKIFSALGLIGGLALGALLMGLIISLYMAESVMKKGKMMK
ncbi:MAG: hypothetical protein Q8R29_03580 [bacterium]|nr:hypothetical protein [bacterium]